jgi:hypothetical protein
MASRIRIAAAVAPAATMLAFWALMFAVTRLAHPDWVSRSSAGFTLFFFMFFGLPIVYFGAGVLAYPVYRALERRGLLRPSWIVASATALGAAFAPAVTFLAGVPTSRDDLMFTLAVAGIGAVSGALGAGLFSLIGLRRSSPMRAS